MFDSLQPLERSLPGSCVCGILRREYWSGLPCPPPGNLPDLGIEPLSLMSPALAGRLFATSATWGAHASFCSPAHCWVAFHCWKDCSLFRLSPAGGNLDSLHYLAVLNNDAVSIHKQIFLWRFCFLCL